MPGYSGTPLWKKLGYKPGFRVHLLDAPQEYLDWIQPVPEGVEFVDGKAAELDLVHWFVTERSDLARDLPKRMRAIHRDGTIWISWPKKSSKRPTTITEDVIREVALPLGLVDVKVCAVDDVWSGLKLVIRKPLR